MPPKPLPQCLRQPQRDPKTRLTEQQERFCREWVRKANGTQAAIRAGYAPNSARVQASRLLSQPRVRERIERLLEARDGRPIADKRRLEQELEEIALADITDVATFGPDGVHLRSSDELPSETRAAIRRARHRARERINREGVIERTVETDVELHDKLRALEILLRVRNYVSTPEWPGNGSGERRPPAIWLPELRPGSA